MAPPRGKYQIKLNAVMFTMMLEDLLSGPCTPQDLAEHTGMAVLTVQRTLRVMHRRGVVHIAAWGEDARGAMTLRVFALGHGKDAKKPPPKTSRFFANRKVARLAAAGVFGSLAA